MMITLTSVSVLRIWSYVHQMIIFTWIEKAVGVGGAI
jgi:hypothetical protein